MRVGGIQKLSLLDYPGRICCTIFTLGCNYSCPFCHNAPMIEDDHSASVLSQEDIIAFLTGRVGLLDGVCITGGEPLLQHGLGAFLHKIKSLGFSVKLDTNGSCPAGLHRLIRDGLVDYVAMDVKNAPEQYAQTIGIAHYDLTPVRESVSLLLSGVVPYEFRTTVVREFHTSESLIALARWIRGAERYYLQSFVDSNHVPTRGLSAYSDEEMHFFLELLRPILPSVSLRGI